jgi:hypothetical protein
MSTCKLCHREQILCNSHIIPEFLWSNLYDKNHKLIGVTGQGRNGWSTLQKGIREKLFCNECEQYFNEHFEKPFRKYWVEECPLLCPWEKEEILWLNVDYPSFKLFHLSVLYRAHVSTLPTFEQVELGPHAEKIREMLLSRDAGPAHCYPIFGYAVIHHKTNCPVQMISYAQASNFDNLRCYGIMYGGVEWWMGVASHTNNDFQIGCLQANGRIPIAPIPWNEIGSVLDARDALQNKNT